jgi:hypothetical protein
MTQHEAARLREQALTLLLIEREQIEEKLKLLDFRSEMVTTAEMRGKPAKVRVIAAHRTARWANKSATN